MYAPYIKQEEPLKTECQHFLDCILNGTMPLSCGTRGTELVRILEASSKSLQLGGAPVNFSKARKSRAGKTSVANGSTRLSAPVILTNGSRAKKISPRPAPNVQVKIQLASNGH